MRQFFGLLLLAPCVLASVSGCNKCDANQAQNKMLALGKVQARLAADGGEAAQAVSLRVSQDSGPVSELIAQGKYDEACVMADEVAKKLGVDLTKEQEGVLTVEQLAENGGKGTGTCSVVDAAKKQMEVIAALQAEIDTGRKSSTYIAQFNDDTRDYAQLLTTNPSEACALLDRVKAKYKLP